MNFLQVFINHGLALHGPEGARGWHQLLLGCVPSIQGQIKIIFRKEVLSIIFQDEYPATEPQGDHWVCCHLQELWEPGAITQTWTSSVTWLSWGVPVPRRPGKAGRDEAGQGRRQLQVHQYQIPDQTNQPDLLYKALLETFSPLSLCYQKSEDQDNPNF